MNNVTARVLRLCVPDAGRDDRGIRPASGEIRLRSTRRKDAIKAVVDEFVGRVARTIALMLLSSRQPLTPTGDTLQG
jgi:hypothetical protein